MSERGEELEGDAACRVRSAKVSSRPASVCEVVESFFITKELEDRGEMVLLNLKYTLVNYGALYSMVACIFRNDQPCLLWWYVVPCLLWWYVVSCS